MLAPLACCDAAFGAAGSAFGLGLSEKRSMGAGAFGLAEACERRERSRKKTAIRRRRSTARAGAVPPAWPPPARDPRWGRPRETCGARRPCGQGLRPRGCAPGPSSRRPRSRACPPGPRAWRRAGPGTGQGHVSPPPRQLCGLRRPFSGSCSRWLKDSTGARWGMSPPPCRRYIATVSAAERANWPNGGV